MPEHTSQHGHQATYKPVLGDISLYPTFDLPEEEERNQRITCALFLLDRFAPKKWAEYHLGHVMERRHGDDMIGAAETLARFVILRFAMETAQ